MCHLLRVLKLGMLSIVLLLAARVPAPAAQSEGLTEEGYCSLYGRILILLELEWKDRLAAAEATSERGQELWDKLEQVGAKFRVLRSSVYRDMSMNEEAFTRFSRENKDSIEQYLNDHPNTRADLESVNGRVAALVQQFEAKMQPR